MGGFGWLYDKPAGALVRWEAARYRVGFGWELRVVYRALRRSGVCPSSARTLVLRVLREGDSWEVIHGDS